MKNTFFVKTNGYGKRYYEDLPQALNAASDRGLHPHAVGVGRLWVYAEYGLRGIQLLLKDLRSLRRARARYVRDGWGCTPIFKNERPFRPSK